MMHKQSSLPLIEFNENCSSKSINMMIGGMLSMISQVMKKDVAENTPSQRDREIKLCFILSDYCFNIFANNKKQFESDHITISHC